MKSKLNPIDEAIYAAKQEAYKSAYLPASIRAKYTISISKESIKLVEQKKRKQQ